MEGLSWIQLHNSKRKGKEVELADNYLDKMANKMDMQGSSNCHNNPYNHRYYLQYHQYPHN